ncbi:PD-(D/E)XK nuclease family protein [Tropicibacter oceani]|uniref:PD-(D/E)XK nuclease family protein n=1 Tax=Tropicibacter oceani TaxID=3058420 RepID=A0ABY8QE40_9RHOB|nr:PD-(D/E)XK nuclease family protein [Tropicibacter oceani]WGW02769.1 PD-(D/E)XK nuclease family protein [Tropicibacter oceani]
MRIDPLLTKSPLTDAVRHVTDALLAEVYLAPDLATPDLTTALGPGAPWSNSFAVAPQETARAVEAGLASVARATRRIDPADLDPDALAPGRARSHLTALRDLWRDLGSLPGPLNIWAHVLRSKPHDALEPLPLLGAPCPFAAPAEAALADTLRAHHGDLPHPEITAQAAAGTTLRHIQDNLGRSAQGVAADGSLSCHGLRDPREEAEFAAAHARALLDSGRVDSPQEIGLLVPDSPAYALALPEAFDRVGLPLSGQPDQPGLRDLAGELLSLLLVLLAGPAPRTALASVYVSALMPWPAETGRQMAREVIDRGYSRTARQQDGAAAQALEALRPCQTPAQLFARLGAVARAAPAATLHPRIAALKAVTDEVIDWPLLRRLAAPCPQPASGHDRFVEGVSLFGETALPWRPVRQMLVLGMAGRHWPRLPGSDPFFTEAEIAEIRASGLLLHGRQQKLERGMALLRRQLGAAQEGLTLLVPALDLAGARLSPSTGLALIAHMLGAKEPADLVQDLRSLAAQDWPVASHPAAAVPLGGAPALPANGLIHLQRGLATSDKPGIDLLRLRETGDGPLRHSPSRLETLLVSPLAWLLDELDAKDRTWAPETLDVMTLGTLMHQVLEDVFVEARPVPADDDIASAIPAVLENALDRHADWLLDAAWATERRSLEREARDICLSWAGFLRKAGAEILHNEIDLKGDHGGLLLHGKADCLLRLPDGRILVIDHKRASARGRRDRMARGWDLQVALYRAMLERPSEQTPLTQLVRGGAKVATAYHTLIDGSVLSDADGAGLAGVECVGENASDHAMKHLAQMLSEVGAGTLRLNHAGDARRFEKERGIKAYALDNALVEAFCLPDPEAEEEDAE